MHVWTKLAAAKWVDAWEERFAGNPNFVVEYLKGARSVRLRLFCQTEQECREIVERFGGSMRAVARAEWNPPVAAPRPVKVRGRLVLTAETRRAALAAIRRQNPRREVVSIPPEMAFGTGDHATTSTCLRLLVDVCKERRNAAWSLADLGTGTGVLAIAGRRLGATRVYACDFDPFAVAAARRNAERNKTCGIVIEEQDVLQWRPPAGGFDVVTANLFSTVLIEAWPVVVRALAPQGSLIVSGILAGQAWDVFTAAAGHGIGFTKVVRKGKWITARGGRMEDLIAGGA